MNNSYPGGKGGVFRLLIDEMPPHDTYIETHLGGGAIMLNKRPASWNIGVDRDYCVIKQWSDNQPQWVNNQPIDIGGFRQIVIPGKRETMNIVYDDAIKVIKRVADDEHIAKKGTTFIYCDPPYVMETRKSGPLYRCEYTDDQHRELLKLLVSLKATMVMISGYRHAMYDEALSTWRRMDYTAPTRHGGAPESAWMNYPVPTRLHDYQYLGENFRQRERIRKKKRRWTANLMAMPVLEQQAILEALNDLFLHEEERKHSRC